MDSRIPSKRLTPPFPSEPCDDPYQTLPDHCDEPYRTILRDGPYRSKPFHSDHPSLATPTLLDSKRATGRSRSALVEPTLAQRQTHSPPDLFQTRDGPYQSDSFQATPRSESSPPTSQATSHAKPSLVRPKATSKRRSIPALIHSSDMPRHPETFLETSRPLPSRPWRQAAPNRTRPHSTQPKRQSMSDRTKSDEPDLSPPNQPKRQSYPNHATSSDNPHHAEPAPATNRFTSSRFTSSPAKSK